MVAWLNATPKPPEGSKRSERGQRSLLSRKDRMKRDGIVPAMPPNPAPHLIGWLTEMGITEATGVGPVPLSWREISEWQRNTGVHLQPWEARLIRKLSVSYLAASHDAESETCPPPWRAEVTQVEMDAAEAQLRSVLG